MTKSDGAFRTISEVSEWLDTPTHVLRFWESKFTQIKPVKRAGGRRYYRPEDIALLGGIKSLLHDQGLTIKGVQKLLRDQGNRAVMALGPHGLPDGPELAVPDDQPQEMDQSPVARTAPQRPMQSLKAALPDLTPAAPAFLRSLVRLDRRLNSARAARIAPFVAQLATIADRMART